MSDDAEVDFFGAHIKVKSARLAALLNSGFGEDVVVVGGRARELVSPDERDDEMNAALGGIEARREAGAAPASPQTDQTDPSDPSVAGTAASEQPPTGPQITEP